MKTMVCFRWKMQISNSLYPIDWCGNGRIHDGRIKPGDSGVNDSWGAS
jgi:hypothetical protein